MIAGDPTTTPVRPDHPSRSRTRRQFLIEQNMSRKTRDVKKLQKKLDFSPNKVSNRTADVAKQHQVARRQHLTLPRDELLDAYRVDLSKNETNQEPSRLSPEDVQNMFDATLVGEKVELVNARQAESEAQTATAVSTLFSLFIMALGFFGLLFMFGRIAQKQRKARKRGTLTRRRK